MIKLGMARSASNSGLSVEKMALAAGLSHDSIKSDTPPSETLSKASAKALPKSRLFSALSGAKTPPPSRQMYHSRQLPFYFHLHEIHLPPLPQ